MGSYRYRLMTNKVAAILQRGEAVLTQDHQRALGSMFSDTGPAGASEINMTVQINGSVSRAEAEEIAGSMANRLRQEMPETAVCAVTTHRYSGGY